MKGKDAEKISKVFLKWVLIVFVFTFFVPVVNAQWVQTNGPGAGEIITINSNNNTLYASTYKGGIFMSQNNGSNWTAINSGLIDHQIYCINFDGSAILIGTENGVAVSTNNGTSWTYINNGITDRDVKSMLVLNGNYYAGTDTGIYISSNAGNTWNLSGLEGKDVISLASDSIYLFAGIYNGGMFRSSDSGQTWPRITNGIGTYDRIISFYSKGSFMLAGAQNKFFTSLDYGTSWTNNSTGLPATYFVDAICAIGTTLFAALSDGIYRSTDNGAYWYMCSSTLGYMGYRYVYSDGSDLYAGHCTDFFQSSSLGFVWSRRNQGFIGSSVITLESFDNILYASDYAPTFSADSGSVWYPADVDWITRDFEWVGNVLMSATVGGLRESTDSGRTWTFNLSFPRDEMFLLSLIDSNLYASTLSKIYFSSDSGSTWNDITFNLSLPVSCIKQYGNHIFVGGGSGVYEWNGNGWNLVVSTNIYDVTAIKSVFNYLYISTEGDGVLYSIDTGITWISVNNGLNNMYTTITSYNNDLYVWTPDRLYCSYDGGNNWIDILGNLPLNEIHSLAVNSEAVYIGTNAGVWKNATLLNNRKETQIADQLSIYPNPGSGEIHIHLDNFENINNSIVMFNYSGRRVLHQKFRSNDFIINTDQFNPGIYLVKITIKDKCYSKTLIIN